MIRFPNCKINLGLHVLGKRSDGYHDLETIFYPLNIHDALEILPLSNAGSEPRLTLSGLPVSGNSDSNLCVKAWHLLRSDFPQLPAVNIYLHKAIPMGAGLGGGSANGAFMLMMLNEQFDLGLPPESLAQYALQLGSDCPFFIYNQPLFATGRGEVMQKTSIGLSSYYFYIVNPNIHINTGEAFQELRSIDHPFSLQKMIQQPVQEWKETVKNDFEDGIAKKHPAIADLKQRLYQHGAIYAAMTGSGSTVFGLFDKQPQPLSFPEDYFVRIVKAE